VNSYTIDSLLLVLIPLQENIAFQLESLADECRSYIADPLQTIQRRSLDIDWKPWIVYSCGKLAVMFCKYAEDIGSD
jgi:hypothetical protein